MEPPALSRLAEYGQRLQKKLRTRRLLRLQKFQPSSHTWSVTAKYLFSTLHKSGDIDESTYTRQYYRHWSISLGTTESFVQNKVTNVEFLCIQRTSWLFNQTDMIPASDVQYLFPAAFFSATCFCILEISDKLYYSSFRNRANPTQTLSCTCILILASSDLFHRVGNRPGVVKLCCIRSVCS